MPEVRHASRARAQVKDDAALACLEDLVVTRCDEAKVACPLFHGAGRILRRSLPDPAAVTAYGVLVGTGDEGRASLALRRHRVALPIVRQPRKI